MTISVILPFYNGAHYVGNTMRNLIEHQFKNWPTDDWEIILVNDGSTDVSTTDARTWAQDFPSNVILIEQPNSGVSVARNAGIKQAKGKYIYFIDADDILLPDALKLLVDIADHTNADLVRFWFERINSEQYAENVINPKYTIPVSPEIETPTVSEFLETTHAMLDYRGLWSLWSSLFKREFIEEHKISFVEGLHVGQDKIFMWQTLLANPRLTLINNSLYLYHVHEANVTNNKSVAHLHRRQEAIKKLNDIGYNIFLNNRNRFSPTVRKYYKIGLSHEIVSLIQLAIAFNEPIANLNELMRKYQSYTGRFRSSKRLLIHSNVKDSKRAKRLAWLATRIILPYHCLFHHSEYRNL